MHTNKHYERADNRRIGSARPPSPNGPTKCHTNGQPTPEGATAVLYPTHTVPLPAICHTQSGSKPAIGWRAAAGQARRPSASGPTEGQPRASHRRRRHSHPSALHCHRIAGWWHSTSPRLPNRSHRGSQSYVARIVLRPQTACDRRWHTIADGSTVPTVLRQCARSTFVPGVH